MTEEEAGHVMQFLIFILNIQYSKLMSNVSIQKLKSLSWLDILHQVYQRLIPPIRRSGSKDQINLLNILSLPWSIESYLPPIDYNYEGLCRWQQRNNVSDYSVIHRNLSYEWMRLRKKIMNI
jgi:hypothetical protein